MTEEEIDPMAASITIGGKKIKGLPPPDQAHQVPAPEWCVFRVGEMIPLKGFMFKFLGYTEKYEPVFQHVGMTGKRAKEISKRRK